ncbi:MAG: sodium:proton antiporter [Dorea formicigenerans]
MAFTICFFLLCIAVMPLLRAEWWEAHQPLVVFMWIILLVVPFAIVYGAGDTFETVLECIVNDYLTFIVLLFVFYHLDKKAYRKDIAEGRKPDISRPGTEFYIEGLHNIILLAAFLSIKTTDSSIRTKNHFTWGAIKEVAVLFIGIFITMQPALMLLKSVGPNLGISEPYQMFWATGALSSFLDNTPTYLVFLTTAGTLGLTGGITTALGQIPVNLLEAISCGAVFMGANTYIGNAPNFMVKAISDENGVNMPSFFGYILWSLAFLVPVFILDMLVFFL